MCGPPSHFLNCYRGSDPKVKRPGRAVDHSFPTSAEFWNEWSYTSTPPSWLGQSKFYLYLFSLVPAGRFRDVISNWRNVFAVEMHCFLSGADKSLARPGRKQATATEYFEFHISYLLSQLEEY
jgi:hypothetical protein